MQRVQVTSSPIALLHATALDGLLVLALVRLTLHERLAEEARHLVAGKRPRRLEARRGEDDEVERGLALRVPRSNSAAQHPRGGNATPAKVAMIAAYD